MKQLINTQKRPKKTFKQALQNKPLLLLPSAHDALTARLLDLAGFDAYQVGIFSLAGSHFAFPDIGLTSYGENVDIIKNIIEASNLPVVIDAEDGYGDVKNVTRTVQGYESIGASALFIEDQEYPNRCGHMPGQKVISAQLMVAKIKAAISALNNKDTFIIARTDARQAININEAIKRLHKYAQAGAHGLVADGLYNLKDLKAIAKEFKGIPLGMITLEGQEKMPWYDPNELADLGYNMILYPTTILFQVTKTIETAAKNLKNYKSMPKKDSVNFEKYDSMLELPSWVKIEKKFK